MGCGCGGGKGKSRYSGVKSKVYTPAKVNTNFNAALPQVKGMLSLPAPALNDAAAARRIKELNKQAVNRARGIT